MERYYIATLNAIRQMGNKTVKKLIEIFGSAENVWRAELSQIQQTGLNSRAFENFVDFRSKYPDAIEKLVEFCNAKKVKICTYYEENYPPILKEISGAPIVFYYRGEIISNAERMAIVGTRDATPYGERVTKIFAEELAAAGFTIVSGAARGIDTFAHKAALKSGRTVAVLGYGINKIPFDRRELFEEIVNSGGAVITEFPPNYDGDKGTFPARNRIIAGLSRGVIVIEAGKKSGALITAGFAADNSRDVFAVPQSIFSEKGAGCHNLIRDGAILITSAEDILEHYSLITEKAAPKVEIETAEKIVKSTKKIAPKIELEAIEKIIYNAIPQDDSVTLEEILMNVEEVSPAEIPSIMLSLELKGYISEIDGAYIRI